MSFTFSFTASDKATAKSELSQRNADSGGYMPDGMEDAVSAFLDAKPDPPEGRMFNVATHGHVATEANPGDSNVTLSIMHVLK
jgi:hypothetical protein